MNHKVPGNPWESMGIYGNSRESREFPRPSPGVGNSPPPLAVSAVSRGVHYWVYNYFTSDETADAGVCSMFSARAFSASQSSVYSDLSASA